MKSQIALSALLRGITSNHDGDFYCLNFFQSYSTEKNLKKHGIVCNDHNYCYVEKPDEYNKILKYNHGDKLLKAPAIIYADLKILIQRKKTKHTPSGYSLFTNCSCDSAENKLVCYKGEGRMERFCKDLREHTKKIINYEKKK